MFKEIIEGLTDEYTQCYIGTYFDLLTVLNHTWTKLTGREVTPETDSSNEHIRNNLRLVLTIHHQDNDLSYWFHTMSEADDKVSQLPKDFKPILHGDEYKKFVIPYSQAKFMFFD